MLLGAVHDRHLSHCSNRVVSASVSLPPAGCALPSPGCDVREGAVQRMVWAHAYHGQPASGGHCPGVVVGFPALDKQRKACECLPLHSLRPQSSDQWPPDSSLRVNNTALAAWLSVRISLCTVDLCTNVLVYCSSLCKKKNPPNPPCVPQTRLSHFPPVLPLSPLLCRTMCSRTPAATTATWTTR